MFNYALNNCEICNSDSQKKVLNPYHCLQCQQYYKTEGLSSLANLFLYTNLRNILAGIGLVLFLIAKYFQDNHIIMSLVTYISAQVSFGIYFYITRFPLSNNSESKPVIINKEEFQMFLKKEKRNDFLFIFIFVLFHIISSYLASIQNLPLFHFLSFPILLVLIYFPYKSIVEINTIKI